MKSKIKGPQRAGKKEPSEPHALLRWPPNLDTHHPAAVVFHLSLDHRDVAVSPGCLCVLPSSYKDTGHIRLSFYQLQCDLILTNYINIDPISKQCHILRYWGLGLQHLLCRGHNSTHNSIPIPFFFFFFLLNHAACRISVPQIGIKPEFPAVEAQSPNHWTTKEFPHFIFQLL